MTLLERPQTKTVEKLFKILQNGSMTFNFSRYATTPFWRDLDLSRTKIIANSFI